MSASARRSGLRSRGVSSPPAHLPTTRGSRVRTFKQTPVVRLFCAAVPGLFFFASPTGCGTRCLCYWPLTPVSSFGFTANLSGEIAVRDSRQSRFIEILFMQRFAARPRRPRGFHWSAAFVWAACAAPRGILLRTRVPEAAEYPQLELLPATAGHIREP